MVEETETWVGAFFTSFVTLAIGGLIAFMIEHELSKPHWPLYAWIAAAIVWLLLDFPAALWWWITARRDRPAAVAAALKQPRFPFLLRPLVAFWWLIHFTFGLFFVYLAHFQGEIAPDEDPAMRYVVFAMGVGYCLVANGFLVNAVAALRHSRAAVEHVWARRWFVDAAVVLAGVVAMLLPHSASGL